MIPDEAIETALNARVGYTLAVRDFITRHQRENIMRTALKAAYPAIRRAALEEAARALDDMAASVQDHGQADAQQRLFFVTGLAQGATEIRALMGDDR